MPRTFSSKYVQTSWPPRRVKPESWDEATDVRRFWWVLPPLTFALLTVAAIWLTGELRPGDSLKERADEVHQVFPVTGATHLTIENIAGDVTIQAGHPNEVDITVQRQGVGITEAIAFDNLARLQLRIERTADGVSISTTEDPPAEVRGGTRAQITIRIPRLSTVDVVTGTGKIVIAGVDGDVSARVARGDIDLGLSPDLSFKVKVSGVRLTTDFVIAADPGQSLTSYAGTVGVKPSRTMLLAAPAGTILLRRTPG